MVKTVRCIKCGEVRESEFYPSCIKISDYRCKSCCNEYVRPYVKAYMRNHPAQNNASFKRWYANNAEAHYERTLAYVRADPQRHRAQYYAWRAFPNKQICELEGCFEFGERHHDDYNKPYEIRWLCRKHHKELSREPVTV